MGKDDELRFRAETIAEQRKEIKRLQAIVDKPPKTVDGVSLVPEMVVYVRHFDNKIHAVKVLSVCEGAVMVACEYNSKPAPVGNYSSDDCYSTHEAAEAARKEGQ